ncbi:MAG: putative Se/S carrier-like protein [Ruminococcus sp.]
MENRLIMLSSITHAVRAKNVLATFGIHAYVQKTPKINNANSCGYSVFVPQRADEAERILTEKGFTILGTTGRSG